MKNLRERCNNFYEYLSSDVTVQKIEAFAREIRNEALEELALIGEQYAGAAKNWGLKCDSSDAIRALKTTALAARAGRETK